MDKRRLEFIKEKEFLRVYYHFSLPLQKEYEYQNIYYRLYGLNPKTYYWENIPSFGTYFNELGDVYDYIHCLDEMDYLVINIIKFDSKLNMDELYDTVSLKRDWGLKRKKYDK